MITKEFLSQCSDEQINRGVAWCVVSNKNISMNLASEKYSFAASFLRSKCNKILINHKRYCSNANDIMPIALANNFLIEPPSFFTNKWSVTKYYIVENIGERSVKATNTNPLRAICEVYILMSVNK